MGVEQNDLTLEKIRVAERLTALEIVIKELSEKISNAESLFISHIAEDRRMFHGNGGTGIMTRLDRIEQREKGREWTIRAIVVAILGVFGKMFSDWVR